MEVGRAKNRCEWIWGWVGCRQRKLLQLIVGVMGDGDVSRIVRIKRIKGNQQPCSEFSSFIF